MEVGEASGVERMLAAVQEEVWDVDGEDHSQIDVLAEVPPNLRMATEGDGMHHVRSRRDGRTAGTLALIVQFLHSHVSKRGTDDPLEQRNAHVGENNRSCEE